MPVSPTNFIMGVSPTTFTVPSGYAIVSNIIVANSGTATGTFIVAVSGVPLLGNVTLTANSSAFFDIKQVVASGLTIVGSGTAGTSFFISGVMVN